MNQMCESMDKNRIQGISVGRAGNLPRSPYSSKDAKRRFGDCAQKVAELTSGDLLRVAKATETAVRQSDRRAEVSGARRLRRSGYQKLTSSAERARMDRRSRQAMTDLCLELR
ncbi:MAG: hypothetical protein ACR2IV_02460, partial [Bryobacteraceae bacterium]